MHTLRRRLLFQIWRTAPGHSDAFSRPAALIAGERCAYQPQDWAAGDLTSSRVRDDSTVQHICVPLGINISEHSARLGVSPHTQWHWGPEARWTSWAPLGGIGRI